MTVTEVEAYYGKKSADWVRDKIADGTFRPPVVAIRLENPKCMKQFLQFHDVVGYTALYESPMIKLPDHSRAFDTVQVEIEEEKL